MIRSRLILYVAPDGATLLLPRKGGLPPTLLSCERDDEAGNATLDAALALHARHPLTLLIDTPDIHFEKTDLPQGLSFWDRRKLLNRRLDLAFGDSPYKVVAARSNSAALFAALSTNDTLTHWTERLRPFRSLPFSVALLPLELRSLLHQKPESGWTLDLILTRHGGLRITAFKDGLALLSRQVPLDDTPDEQQEALAEEINKTLAFMPRLGLCADDPVAIFGLLPAKLQDPFKNLETSQPVTTSLLTPQEFVHRLGLPFKPSEETAPTEALLLLSLSSSRHPFSLELWTKEEAKTRREKRIRLASTTLGTLCLTLALIAFAVNIFTLSSAYKTNRLIQSQTASLQKDFTSRRTKMEQETAELNQLRQAAERQKLYAKSQAPLATVLAALQNTLPPAMRLTEVSLSGKVLSLTVKTEEDSDLSSIQKTLGKALPDLQINIRGAPPVSTGDDHAP